MVETSFLSQELVPFRDPSRQVEYDKARRKDPNQAETIRLAQARYKARKRQERLRERGKLPPKPKKTLRELVAAGRDKRRRLLNQFKSRPCTDCGGTFNPVCMDFDHQRDKSFTISREWMTDLDALLDEIVKCDLVCANCHRIRTHNAQRASLCDT